MSLIESLIDTYSPQSVQEYENALREIIQELALLGMWRAKFFEKGAFYGGTALRILYGLDRFSEDLDFTLFVQDKNFDISYYESILKREIESFGLSVTVQKKAKTKKSSIESAFIKANTLIHILRVNSNLKTHSNKVIKVKLEVDTNPSKNFLVVEKPMLKPIPFTIRTLDLSSLFAGKVAAALYRPYKFNTKGRDWYDLLWYINRRECLNLKYFESMAIENGNWDSKKAMKEEDLHHMLHQRVDNLDIKTAQNDVRPFLKYPERIDGWSRAVFHSAVDKICIQTKLK